MGTDADSCHVSAELTFKLRKMENLITVLKCPLQIFHLGRALADLHIVAKQYIPNTKLQDHKYKFFVNAFI